MLKSGYVEMLEDRQIFPSLVVGSSLNKSNENEAKITPVNFDLAVRRYATFRHRKSGLVLFTKSAERKFISASEFMAYAKSAGSISYLSNLLIEGEVTFGAGENVTGVECSNLQFLDGILFDHCIVSSAFRFEHCQFLGTFGAPGTRFHSQVAVKHSEIFAVTDIFQSAKDEAIAPYTALDLDSVSIDSGLSLECLTVHASVSCRHLTVRSDANLSGMRVLPLVEENWWRANKQPAFWAAPLSDSVLFDLQRSSFAGSLNLGIWVDRVQARKSSGRRVTVCGDCRFDTMSVGKSLILEGLAVVKSDEEKVDREKFQYGVSARTLSMSNVMVKGNIQSWEYDSSDPTGATINPPLLIDGLIDLKWSKVDGYVDLRGSHVTGDLDCTGMRAAWLTLEHSRLSDVDSSHEARHKADEISWAQYSILDPASRISPVGTAPEKWIDQFVERMSVVQGDLNLGNAIIPGGVNLRGASIGGTVFVYLGAELGLMSALPCFGIYTEFPETTDESGAKRRVPIKRTVVKQSASLGRLSIRDSTIAGPVNLWGAQIRGAVSQRKSVVAKPVIDISTSSIKGGLYLHARSSWEGQDVLHKLLNPYNQEGPKYDWVDHLGEGIKDKSIREMAESYLWQTVPDVFHATVKGDVDILASDIRADLDLTNAQVTGRIRLNDSHVRCDVRAVACLQELDTKFKAPDSGQEAALLTELQTQCFHFEFQSLRCDGDLMLAGLHVKRKESTSSQPVDTEQSGVDGRNAIVRGHVELVCDESVNAQGLRESTKQKDEEKGRASIEGDLDLCGCEIGLLKLDGYSFPDQDGIKSKIDLSRCTLSTLKLFGALPKSINLQSIKVGNWEITKSKNENEANKGKRLVKLLEATKEYYDSGPYQSIEASLASEGKDEDADDVHRAKNWREIEEKEKGFRPLPAPVVWFGWLGGLVSGILVAGCFRVTWLWLPFVVFLAAVVTVYGKGVFSWLKLKCWDRWILGKMMGFGTRLLPAFAVWLLLALGLSLVLSDRHNVQPTFAAVNAGLGKTDFKLDPAKDTEGINFQATRRALQKYKPAELEWGWPHAFWLALDITVPLVPFNLHDEWEPRESTEETVMPCLLCCSHCELPVAPKTMANILAPVSWFIWSLIATGMAGLIRTRS